MSDSPQRPQAPPARSRPRRAVRWILGLVVVLGVVMAALDVWVYGDFTPPRLPPMDPLPGVGSLSAQQCRACHPAIYDEWAKSGHARAFVDPLYQAELRHQRTTFVCHRCHTPLVEQRPSLVYGLWLVWPRVVPISWPNERFDAALQSEGVTCVACHQADGHMLGPVAQPWSPPHPTKVAQLRAVDPCGRCHQFGFTRIGHLDRPIIDTMTEWQGYRDQGGEQRCADCHMPLDGEQPLVTGGPTRPHTDHTLRGPFDRAFVATGVVVEDLRLGVDEGASGSLRLINGTGHRLPTAEPQRVVRVHLSARSTAGEVLAVEEVRFERPVDVGKLRELGPDTTLAPREERSIELSLPRLPDGTATVQIAVDFHLWHADDIVAIEAGLGADDLVHRITSRSLPVAP